MNTIITKFSKISGRKPDPSELRSGEIAINTADGKIFFKSRSSELFEFSADKRASFHDIIKEITINAILIAWFFISVVILVKVLAISIL
jgi:hypothetical protein